MDTKNITPEGQEGGTSSPKGSEGAARLEAARPISEKDGIHEGWYEDARKMTLEQLPDFLKHLTTAYKHDYGTICHAIAAAAVAAAWAVEKSPQGGITGFQGGAVMWQFMEKWNGIKFPARLVQYDDMLYPQYERKFTTISKDTWEHLQKKAGELLKGERRHAHPDVVAHWKKVAEGVIPFGYSIGED